MLRRMYARSTRLWRLPEPPQGAVTDIEKLYQVTFVEAVNLDTDWSRLIEYQNMTHVGERMKPLHCVAQDMEALAKMLASTPRWYQNIDQMCQITFRAIAKWRSEVGWERG